ncbi:MAG TPA: HAD-IIB family hydrolase [Pirellulaceae bacterium]|jgi:HAD superfamily hydrolase (TIGR01484 family)|nr:HAD-IIB family hydrolase [Pirellulaceae bacterium]
MPLPNEGPQATDGVQAAPLVLATDLDGTLIPLDASSEQRRDLETLERELFERDAALIFVTGRHLESVRNIAEEARLPSPTWILCDVGTTICRVDNGRLIPSQEYADRLREISHGVPLASLRPDLERIEGLRVQEEEKLGPFKLSFYCEGDRVQEFTDRVEARLAELDVPYSVVSSVDPFNGDGLVDVLPRGVNKAFALQWWRENQGLRETSIIYAGDSGNDWDALVAGYRAILVGNACRKLAERVAARHAANGWTDRLYLAQKSASSGVLEGWRTFCDRA